MVHRRRVCECNSGIQSSWGCIQEASNSQWVLKTGLQFSSKSCLCQHRKQTGNLRNDKKLAICWGQSAQTIKDSPLDLSHVVAASPAPPQMAAVVALTLAPLAAWQNGWVLMTMSGSAT